MKGWKLSNRGRLLASLSAAALVGSALIANTAVAAPGAWTQTQVNAATTAGVAYIDSQCALNVSGQCGTTFPLSETGMALVAYSVEQAGLGGFANMPAAHQTHVKAAIHYLLINQSLVDGSWADFSFYSTYTTGIDLAGLSAFTTVDPLVPAAIANGRNFLINLDWQGPPRETCSSGQLMLGNAYCGGWNYDPGLARSDESNTGFAMFGLFLTGGVPPAIQAVNIGWQNNIQELTLTNAQYATRNDGGGDYQPGEFYAPFASNANDSGSMLFGYAYDGVLGVDPRVQAGLKFGQDVLDTYEKSLPGTRTGVYHTGASEDGSCAVGGVGCDWLATGDGGYHYSLFSLTKGLGEYIPPVLTAPTNWYAKVVDLLLTEQAGNGSWPQDGRDDGTGLIATAFAVSALGLVAVEQPISNAAGVPFSATEGINKCAPVATFSDADSKAVAGDYTASILWGDATPIDNTATITGNGAGNFTVTGCHTYAEEGPYKIVVTITDADNATNNAVVNTTATVADAALTSACAAPAVLPAGAFTGPTATFTDASSTGTLSDFSATIDWGDSTTSAGTITGGPGTAPYTVSGTHTYTKTGAIVITTTITDVGGSKTVATCNTSRTVCGNDEHDGNGDIKDDHSDKHTSDNRDVKFNSDQDDDNQACDNEQEEPGDNQDNDQKEVDSHDNRSGDDFKSTKVDSVQIESLANGKKGTITGVGIHNGNVVSFTAVEIDNGPGLPGFFSLVLSDGYNVAGSLVDGTISLG